MSTAEPTEEGQEEQGDNREYRSVFAVGVEGELCGGGGATWPPMK